MTQVQLVYPLIAATEVLILCRTRRSPAENATALRFWLIVQIALFCILEPSSFLSAEQYGRVYSAAVIISFLADLVVLHSLFKCLEAKIPVFGSSRLWGSLALLFGIVFCIASELHVPEGARGIAVFWLAVEQALQYLRTAALIGLAFYGWLRASSWPRDLAWTWIAMALYGLVDAVVSRVDLLSSNCNGPLELAGSAAALFQLLGWWRALSYAPKPLTSLEFQGLSKAISPNL